MNKMQMCNAAFILHCVVVLSIVDKQYNVGNDTTYKPQVQPCHDDFIASIYTRF